ERSDASKTERSDASKTERSDASKTDLNEAVGSAPGGAPEVDAETQVDDALGALADIKQRLGEVPAEVVIVNHAMGLYELAAIHLGAIPPRLPEAALAIDAVGCLVDGLGTRLGPDAATLQDALANIRLAFVQIKNTVTASS
ncbi:MAG: hypothetical protein JWM12_3155, partial [Ilumatobacteraceae bacterium]|nr:hypothetical protein [Ilumatobacteraceae bacterium]